MGKTIAEGSNARQLIHSLRFCGYASAALFFGDLFLSSYASTVAAVGELRDPRLQDFQQALRAMMERQTGDPGAMKVQTKDPTGQGDTSVSDISKRHRQDTGGLDDASPNADADGYGGEVEILGRSNTGIMSDAQMRVHETKRGVSPSDTPTGTRTSTFRLDKVEKQPNNFSDTFDDDDASPLAAGNANQSQEGNAWDRIRRQAQTGPSVGKPKGRGWNAIRKEQEDGSTSGDSFAFSSDDEQRQLAKDEAQNEFDARVERERQGGNFNENRGKRW